MRVGILLADHVRDEMQALAGGDYDVVYTNLLHLADPTIETVAYDVINGELPASPDECDAWLITGARHDSFADEEWIRHLKDFIRDVNEQKAKMAGICFGHQVIAEALGGKSERAPEWKIGPQEMTLAPQDWFPGGTVWVSAVHKDQVTSLPEGAEPIAEGTTATFPGYRIADHIITVQDHPEYDSTFAEGLLDRYESVMDTDIAAEGRRKLQSTPTDRGVVAEWIVRFLQGRELTPSVVESVQTGSAEEITIGLRQVVTGHRKLPVESAFVGPLGLEGDTIADLRHHGGPDQAVYVYSREDFEWWEKTLGRELPAGSFGENITVSSVGVAPVRVGDRLSMGEVILEITGPRIPCNVFQTMLGEADWPSRFNEARRPGYYCRVIQGGEVRAGDDVVWTASPPENVTVVEMADVWLDPKVSDDRIRRALASPLGERAREAFEERLVRRSRA